MQSEKYKLAKKYHDDMFDQVCYRTLCSVITHDFRQSVNTNMLREYYASVQADKAIIEYHAHYLYMECMRKRLSYRSCLRTVNATNTACKIRHITTTYVEDLTLLVETAKMFKQVYERFCLLASDQIATAGLSKTEKKALDKDIAKIINMKDVT